MTIPLWCLLGFVSWTILLVLSVAVWRSVEVLIGQRGPNDFPSGTKHGPDAYWRINRAHLNAAENLPLFASVVLVAHVAGVRSDAFNLLAEVYVGARVVQSIMHVASNWPPLAYVRFTGFVVQLACLVGMMRVIARFA